MITVVMIVLPIVVVVMIPVVVVMIAVVVVVMIPRAIVPRVVIPRVVVSPTPAHAPVASAHPETEVVKVAERVRIKARVIPDHGHGVSRVGAKQEFGIKIDVRGGREPPVAVV
jgi:hypothetical protein